jgi:hypothetical protein
MSAHTDAETTYDLCVVGSGPAGIIVALEYSKLNPKKKVILVEYGKKGQHRKNNLDDSIEVLNKVNHHDPYECTNKGLGGSSATWGGRCVMYDEVDFVDRPIVAGGCTWRYELFEELKRHLSKAADYFECGKPVFDLREIPRFKNQRIAENFIEGNVTDSVLERWSMPTRFGKRYDREIRQSRNITFLEGYEARSFSSPDKRNKVGWLKIRKVGTDEILQINAKYFVLAMGTQETTRTLLRNKHLFDNLGKVPSALGKYYQGHVSGKIASVKFSGDPRKTDYGFLRDEDGTYLRRRFQFTRKFLVEHNLLNTAIWLDNPLYFNPKHRSGAMSFMYLAMITPILGKKLAPPAIAHSITKGKVTGLPQHIGNVLKGLPHSLTIPAAIFYKRYCLKRKLPGVFLFSPNNVYALHFHAEQIPHEANRMELGSDGETLIIHYDLLEDDVQSVIKLHRALDDVLQQSTSGKLEYWYSPEELPAAIRKMSKDGIHQSGTTRIANSPEEGVVDHNLRLFGTDNVYVCSSSVFPTSGQANPTFAIGAFGVRLAEYLSNINEESTIS